MKKIFLLSAIALTFAACDEVDQPLENEFGFLPFPDSSSKVVLIEEFTGVKCNNCPRAAEKAKSYEEQAPGQVVVLAIHSSNFSVPDEKHPNDFRTVEGTELYDFFSPIGVPSGMFDRVGHPDNHSVLLGDWDASLQERLNAPTPCEITSTLTYNEGLQEFSLKVSTAFIEGVEADVFLCAYLTENGIVGPQTMPDYSINNEYVHNHVLRRSFNGIYGQMLVTNPSQGDVAQKTLSLEREPEWVAENCSAVVFVYDRSNYQVLQAHYAKLGS